MNKLMPNYGWVQNTSNLSTIRDTLDLVPEYGIKHLDLMNAIKNYRVANNDLPSRWTWDARCRIKALHATGLIKLNRYIQGYDLTELGKRLRVLPQGNEYKRGLRLLTNDEINIFKEGLLTNPPVVRVLSLFEVDRRGLHKGLSKYDLGKELGFIGDIGFTHIDPFWVVSNGYSFNDKEGDADKWSRTIISWLSQVGWVEYYSNQAIEDKQLRLYSTNGSVEEVLRYDAQRIVRNVPAEMLCSDHHPFPRLVQKRRALILGYLLEGAKTPQDVINYLNSEGIQFSQRDCEFEIINLRSAGFRIIESAGYFKLADKLNLDVPLLEPEQANFSEVDELIEELVVKYEKTLPSKLVDHLLRFGYDPVHCTEFEGIVAELFRNLGYSADYLGQGHGRVSDVLVKYVHPTVYARSYGIIIDAKSTAGRYSFPAGDKRKMKEYIQLHGPKLLAELVQNHAFAFISPNFVVNLIEHLEEISRDTSINGSAIEVKTLLALGDKVNKGELDKENIFPMFTTNNLFALP